MEYIGKYKDSYFGLCYKNHVILKAKLATIELKIEKTYIKAQSIALNKSIPF